MDEQDDITQHSATERQLRLIVPAPAAYATGRRIDVIHDPDPDLLPEDPR